MKRREFIALLSGLAAIAWPLLARAQQIAMPVIGFLSTGTREGYAPFVAAFHEGLKEAGYIEGQNVAIEYRWAEGRHDQLPALASELVRLRVTLIAATGGTPSALAAKAATSTIPIVFYLGIDPVQFGLVASLNRPGGNMTGIAALTIELEAKRLEFLHELLPTAAIIAVLVNPNNPAIEAETRSMRDAVRSLGLQLEILRASAVGDIDTAFAALVELRAGALIVLADAFLTSRRNQIVALAARHAVPAMFHWREFAVAGGLVSYGPRLADGYRQVGVYVGKILKGAKPADLPVQQAVKLELVINLKTAKALGLKVPPALLLRADEVIE
jgi:putative tryptophan/tyrosine transport system substrate-binding protein